jgi:hypothetical protein
MWPIKRFRYIGIVFLLLLATYVATAVPVSAWLLNHRKNGVPQWLEAAYSPLKWLRDHNNLARQFFTWQSRKIPVKLPDELPVALPPKGGGGTPGQTLDVESRARDLDRYFSKPNLSQGAKLQNQTPEPSMSPTNQ